MPVRSMTGYAQLTHQVSDRTSFSLSLKSVNHRFLDLHFRLPANTDTLEVSLRRVLKEKLARGHVDVNLSFEQAGTAALSLNRQLVAAYVQASRLTLHRNFNFNDLYHVIQIVSLFLLYRGARASPIRASTASAST